MRLHLQGCPGCRAEAEETAAAAVLFDRHPEPQALLDHAEGNDGSEDLVSHLEGCARCADELARARDSRRELGLESAAAPPRRGASPAWRQALAAGVAAIAVGLTVWGVQERRLESERQETERLRQRIEGAAAAPRLNLPIVELLPVRRLRADEPGPQPTPVPAAPEGVVLLLQPPDGTACERCSITVLDADGAVIWESNDLRLQATGDYSLLLPGTGLPSGRGELRLYASDDRQTPIARYVIEVR